MYTTSPTLLSRVRDPRDHAAWAEFDARYREMMVRFCLRRGVPHTDAEDVVQRVLASLARTLPTFTLDPARGRFRDYLFRSVRNGISEWAQRPNRQWSPLDTAVADGSSPAGADADSAESRQWEEEWVAHHYRLALQTVRATFDPVSVSVFDRSIEGAKVADLAAEFGLSDQAVYKIRQRIRDRMQELIAQQVKEEDQLDETPRP